MAKRMRNNFFIDMIDIFYSSSKSIRFKAAKPLKQ